jgi:hypothetical protein
LHENYLDFFEKPITISAIPKAKINQPATDIFKSFSELPDSLNIIILESIIIATIIIPKVVPIEMLLFLPNLYFKKKLIENKTVIIEK